MKMKPFLSLIISLFLFQVIQAQDITGSWNGVLDIQGTRLRVVFNIEKNGDTYVSTMDSPDQGAKGIATDETTFKENVLTIKANALAMTFSGDWLPEKNEIKGTFNQSTFSIPLTLSKEPVEQPARPQDPRDFPYRQEEVTFQNTRDEVTLAGTLTLPEKRKVDQVVVLLSGSGPQNRNEELKVYNHRPFLVLSDYLTRQGIGVLRYDDRGVGESTGVHAAATTTDLSYDAEAAVTYLNNRSDLKGAKIGLVGHSEGGMIAPMVAARNKKVDFIVLLAGPGIPITELMLLQSKAVAETAGFPDNLVEADLQLKKDIYAYLLKDTDKSAEEMKPELNEIVEEGFKKYYKSELPESQKEKTFQQYQQMLTPWFLDYIRTKPEDYLRKVKVPVLALNATLDTQVTSKENLAGLETTLKNGGNKKVEIIEMEGLNHIFQKAQTGAVSEYGQIEETFNEEAMQIIAEWIKKMD